MTDANGTKYQINYFLERLCSDEVIWIIREITSVLKDGKGKDGLCSESLDDIDVQIDYPYFLIDNYKFDLNEMKTILYGLLESFHPNYLDFIDEIEITEHYSIRQSMLLKFSQTIDETGNNKLTCESLHKSHKGMCFVQFCDVNDCQTILKKLAELKIIGYTDSDIYLNEAENISIKIIDKWVRFGTLSEHSGLGIQPRGLRTFVQEWIDFLNQQN